MGERVRVHETATDIHGNDATHAAFDLEDFAQFARYAKTVNAAGVNGRPSRLHEIYNHVHRLPQKCHIITLQAASHGNIRVLLQADLAAGHGECAFCALYFDPTAGSPPG